MFGKILSAVGSIGSAIANPILSHNENIRQRKFAEGQSAQQMAFQERMSNTQLQRGIADATAAGLHPHVAAGSGASSPAGSQASPAVSVPQIDMPDLMAYGVSLKQLEQVDQQLAIADRKATADIVKTLSDADLNEFRKVLMQKGAPKATLEGEAADLLRQGINWLKENVRQNKQPHNFNRLP